MLLYRYVYIKFIIIYNCKINLSKEITIYNNLYIFNLLFIYNKENLNNSLFKLN